jgi:hypothetical protein
MKHYLYTAMMFAVQGCGIDTTAKSFNDSPEVQITSHADGAVLDEGAAVEFRAQLSDTNNDTSDLVAAWYANNEMICDWAEGDENGTSSCILSVPIGLSEISVTVKDPMDAGGMDLISVTVATASVSPANEAPSVSIMDPMDSSQYYAEETILFSGVAMDAEDTPSTLQASWSSDIGGVFSVDFPDSAGMLSAETSLGLGEHVVTLTVEDSEGATASDSVLLFVIEDPNTAPECLLASPAAGDIFYSGDMVTILAAVTDAESPPESLVYEIGSDLDGLLSTGSPSEAGEIIFGTAALTEDDHVLWLAGVDEGGLECETSVDISVVAPPENALVFVTSQRYTGDFGGVEGADAICQDLAAAAGHSGTFMAWLSTNDFSSSPAARFTPSSVPYELVDGRIVADNWADLTDGSIQTTIDLDEWGNPSPTTMVYSFTMTDGTPGVFGSASSNCYGGDCNCNGWTNGNQSGSPTPGSAVGQTNQTNDDWTDYSYGNFCGPTGYPFYCFEQ